MFEWNVWFRFSVHTLKSKIDFIFNRKVANQQRESGPKHNFVRGGMFSLEIPFVLYLFSPQYFFYNNFHLRLSGISSTETQLFFPVASRIPFSFDLAFFCWM